MNRLTIIGNLTRDPELRTTQSGNSVCSFTVAVNRRQSAQQRQNGQQPEADFFRVSVWNQMAVVCQNYLAKGRKVAVVGSVSVHTYQGQDGRTYAQLDVMANDVEFLTPKGEATANPEPQTVAVPQPVDPQTGFAQVEMDDELPF